MENNQQVNGIHIEDINPEGLRHASSRVDRQGSAKFNWKVILIVSLLIGGVVTALATGIPAYRNNYVVPDIVAYQIAQSHYRNCLSRISLQRHYSVMSDIINIFPKLEVVKKDIIKILNIKYNLTIINEDPLIIDKWK